MNVIIVMCGGFIGAVLRYIVVERFVMSNFPWATFIVNITGAFALGLCVGVSLSDELYLMFGVGMLGAYTTFSTMSKELFEMLQHKRIKAAASYMAGVYLLGIICTAVGIGIGMWLR
jgi:CrcB protein